MTHMRSVGFELSKDENILLLRGMMASVNILGIFNITVSVIDDATNLLTVYYDSDFITYDKVVDEVETALDIIHAYMD